MNDFGEKTAIIEKYARIFLEKNSRLNLISKNDEKVFLKKHVSDSLAIDKFFQKHKIKKGQKLLDMGTGGGLPAVPIAIFYPVLEVFAIDSISKKINAVEEIKKELELENLYPIWGRVENLPAQNPEKFDYVVTRALAPLDKILKYAIPNLKTGGYFIAYKSKRALDEIKEAQKTLKKYNLKVVEIIEYELKSEQTYQRNLIVIKVSK
ncbi:MAG TPA: 16S rRNA (guanine(527)-N(7))-methyltransferase RsmG [Candidatus Gastranaerophilaceae bacterium]|nr:16S rRNA (guanine(527)-N(7))-methyltransferase RsmG [Candidatus Gastranaerophilaceae bacterium]